MISVHSDFRTLLWDLKSIKSIVSLNKVLLLLVLLLLCFSNLKIIMAGDDGNRIERNDDNLAFNF